MEDSKNLILFIVLSVGILIGWGALFPAPKRVKPATRKQVDKRAKPGQRTSARTVKTAAHTATSQPSTAPTTRQATTQAAKPTARRVAPAPRKVAMPKIPVKKVSFKGKLYNIQISNQGGAIVSLKMAQFRAETKDKKTKERLDLISRTLQKRPPLTEKLLDPQLQKHSMIVYTSITQPKANVILLQGKVPSTKGGYVAVEKKYTFAKKVYHFQVDYKIINKTSHNILGKLSVSVTDHIDPKKLTSGSMFSMPEQLQVICHDPQQASPQRFDSKTLADSAVKVKLSSNLTLGAQTFQGNAKFAGVDRRYFVMAIVPTWGISDGTSRCDARGNKGGWVEVVMQNAGTSIAPNVTKSVKLASYFGPKYYSNLKLVKPGSNLESSVDFGFFAFLSRPMLWLMQFFYTSFDKIGWANWGISIILLTLLVKLITWPLTHKSMQSMKKMQRLKPEMDRLKEKYGEDKESFQREMMNVYVKEGINPVSGCVPMLVQMPIWIALYNTLFYAVELYQAPFIPGWIDDLSAKDPVYILPVSLGVAMFLQQRLTPQTLDNAQAKVMLWAMPIFFTVIMLFLPAGLTLYIFVNTVLGLLHHWHIHNQPDEPTSNSPKKKKAGWMERMQNYIKDQEQRSKSS